MKEIKGTLKKLKVGLKNMKILDAAEKAIASLTHMTQHNLDIWRKHGNEKSRDKRTLSGKTTDLIGRSAIH